MAERLQGLKWYRVDFTLYGTLQVKAKSELDAKRSCLEHELGKHVEDVEVTCVERER